MSCQTAPVLQPAAAKPHAAARPRHLRLKRCFDIALAVLLLIVLSPLLMAIAVAVFVTSGRPILYRQERAGARPRRRGDTVEWERTTFRMLKFRTMRPDADASTAHLLFVEDFVAGRLNGNGQTPFKLSDDPRVTGIGRVLRATSLDELPQLFHVLSGRMSLVGPRPVPLYEAAMYGPEATARFGARPGITGLWQVHGRASVTYQQMVELDARYATSQSLWLDVKLLARTVPIVLTRRGAA